MGVLVLQNAAAVKSSLNSLKMIIAFCLLFFPQHIGFFFCCIYETACRKASFMLWVESGIDSADHKNDIYIYFFFFKYILSPQLHVRSVIDDSVQYLQSQWRSAGQGVVSHSDVREMAADRGRGVHQDYIISETDFPCSIRSVNLGATTDGSTEVQRPPGHKQQQHV